jgi:uncharacterized protein with PIN domain
VHLSPYTTKKKTIREVVMATARIANRSPYGMACTECSEFVIAPECSEYVDEREARHFWSCENCGHYIETVVNLGINARMLAKLLAVTVTRI